MSFLVTLLVLEALFSDTRSQEQCRRPLEYPEMYFDYRVCSTVFDWSSSIPDGCHGDFINYQVQFIENCNLQTSSEIKALNSGFGDYSPGQCLADGNCYARVRAQLRDSSWTVYSTWTGLSITYRMFRGMKHSQSKHASQFSHNA